MFKQMLPIFFGPRIRTVCIQILFDRSCMVMEDLLFLGQILRVECRHGKQAREAGGQRVQRLPGSSRSGPCKTTGPDIAQILPFRVRIISTLDSSDHTYLHIFVHIYAPMISCYESIWICSRTTNAAVYNTAAVYDAGRGSGKKTRKLQVRRDGVQI